MTDPTVATDPEAEADEAEQAPSTIVFTTPTGHEVEMTTAMSGRDLLVLMELEGFDKTRPGTAIPLYPKLLAMIERHVVRHTYPDPDILALDPIVLIRDVMTPWQQQRAEQAVPKASGNRQQRRSSKRR